MMDPDFFLLGAPKCGTTALSEYLRGHPAIFLSSPKEPFHFDQDLRNPVKMDRERYLSLFAGADPSRHKAAGEASTSYLFSREAVPGILRFNPRARFIVMLRNPLEMLPSLHSQRVFNGMEDLLNFQEAWRAQEDRRQGRRLPLSCPEPKRLFYADWGRLGEQLERLYGQVPRERVLVLFTEDFARDPRGTYEAVLAFLGVPTDGRTHFPRVNENKEVVHPFLQPPLKLLISLAMRLKRLLGVEKRFGLLRGALSANSRPASRAPLPEALRRELADLYRQDVAKLSGLTGRDLSGWLA
jgi:hypothetical protein